MTRLPIVSFKTMERVLLRLGFEMVRQKGSKVWISIEPQNVILLKG